MLKYQTFFSSLMLSLSVVFHAIYEPPYTKAELDSHKALSWMLYKSPSDENELESNYARALQGLYTYDLKTSERVKSGVIEEMRRRYLSDLEKFN